KSHNEWAYLLSAGSWKSALLRWNVLNRVKSEAQASAEAYRAAKYELQQLIEQHKNLREDQSVLMADAEKNVKALASEAHAKKQSLSQLEKQERNLRIDLERKNKERNALNKAIEAAIVAELKAAESEKENLADAPAMAKLAKGFQQNKG